MILLRRSLFLFLLLRNLSFASGDSLEVYESHTLSLRFSYPSGFVVGSYDTTNDLTGHFRKLVVLVDPDELGDYSRNAIPPGDVPTIAIRVESDTAGILLKPFTDIDIVRKFFSVDLGQQEFRTEIGANTAHRLPGYPGPYGDASYYYLLPLPEGCYVEFIAHKYFLRREKNPTTGQYHETHYDRVIERIISTLVKYP